MAAGWHPSARWACGRQRRATSTSRRRARSSARYQSVRDISATVPVPDGRTPTSLWRPVDRVPCRAMAVYALGDLVTHHRLDGLRPSRCRDHRIGHHRRPVVDLAGGRAARRRRRDPDRQPHERAGQRGAPHDAAMAHRGGRRMRARPPDPPGGVHRPRRRPDRQRGDGAAPIGDPQRCHRRRQLGGPQRRRRADRGAGGRLAGGDQARSGRHRAHPQQRSGVRRTHRGSTAPSLRRLD